MAIRLFFRGTVSESMCSEAGVSVHSDIGGLLKDIETSGLNPIGLELDTESSYVRVIVEDTDNYQDVKQQLQPCTDTEYYEGI